MKKASRRLNSIFFVAEEMVKDNGEDCFYHDVTDNDFIIAAFDGCGGSGSKKYANFSGKTGAYIASRAVCGGVSTWFQNSSEDNELHKYIFDALSVCKKYADTSGRIMGSLGKAFPTTAAIIKGSMTPGKLKVTCYWAGDSRCYMLNSNGFYQLTVDDLDGQDAMSNLSNDGVLTNVINASTPFEIHIKKLLIDCPCILLTATDGCFGYLNSPMTFEYLLTSSLTEADSISEWKQKLNEKMHEVAGDDYTLTVAVYGFEDRFACVQKAFIKRNSYIKSKYINSECSYSDAWNEYKKTYNNYINN